MSDNREIDGCFENELILLELSSPLNLSSVLAINRRSERCDVEVRMSWRKGIQTLK